MFLFTRWFSRAAFSQPPISRVKSCSQEKKETGTTPLQPYLLENCHHSRWVLMSICWRHFMVCICKMLWMLFSLIITLFPRRYVLCKFTKLKRERCFLISSYTTALHPFFFFFFFFLVFFFAFAFVFFFLVKYLPCK